MKCKPQQTLKKKNNLNFKEREIKMKKIALLIVALFTMSTYSFGEDASVNTLNTVEKYEFKINHRGLSSALGLSKDQAEIADDVMTEFENGMFFASTMDNEESRKQVMSNVISNNIRYMHMFLSKKQYKAYLALLNLTLSNRGFNVSDFSIH